MVRSRRAWPALLLAAGLAGCSELRWHRKKDCECTPASAPAPTKASAHTPAEKLPAVTASMNKPPDYAPALYIPGSAEPTTVKTNTPLPAAPPASPETTELTLPPLTPTEPTISDHPLRALQQRAVVKWASIDGFACRMRRREVVAGQQKPEELIEAHFRKEPFSVYFKWLGPEAKGREVIYVQGQHGNQIHTLTAAGDVVLIPPGTRFKVSPDSMFVKNKSRYAITEAGVGSLVERFGKLIDAVEHNDPKAGTVKYLGQLKRKEFEEKVEVVLQSIPPGAEPQLPGGGQRLWCFDPEHGLPVLIVTHDETNREVEYYCHDRFEFPPRYSDEHFDPERRWAKNEPAKK
jgi:uncharacterized protein DUF1571